MENITVIKVDDYTNLNNGVSSEEGDKINNLIKSAFKLGKIVELDFCNIKLLTTAFLNAAIGQLYKDYSNDYLNKNLKIINIKSSDEYKFELVIKRAKQYFSDKSDFINGVEKILTNE